MTESPHIVIPVVQRDKANAGFRDFVEEAIDNPTPLRRYRIDQSDQCIFSGGVGELNESIRCRLPQP
ncbi:MULTISPECIES: hypothetical protein [Rhizobium]|uniref:hypothetical protein n=1 Tax=Rhizobium TaxID=379 RepID=UPI001038BFBA|nr:MULTISPECIES: hypothetical protein [Rhizobium]MBY3157060.1 hypothetical protein [Rhizobium laguerreae]MBY3171457.1 hypothetical protein [Rhizobium laguerreae]MBY3179024.1 hypothetical protein [Rhizobium leguminosarum]MBY3193503.1 hypothetical protein [Rhizobium laguerreae]MBY3226639.1 hypothetical protein [Rhizobium laguerreae]